MAETTKHVCSCPCGESNFEVLSKPFARFICHCTICQRVYDAHFSDATVMWWSDVKLPNSHIIQFKKYRAFPGVNRGLCASCKSPVIASMGFGPAKLALVPARNFPDNIKLTNQKIHIFYDHRVNDVDDTLPKFNGYLKSEAAVVGHIIRGMIHGKDE